jgi:hypothetical protein
MTVFKLNKEEKNRTLELEDKKKFLEESLQSLRDEHEEFLFLIGEKYLKLEEIDPDTLATTDDGEYLVYVPEAANAS